MIVSSSVVEEIGHERGIDTLAGVFDPDVDERVVGVDLYDHAAGVREFDGIADEVIQDALQEDLVGMHQGLGGIRGHAYREALVFGQRFEQREDFLHQVGHPDRS